MNIYIKLSLLLFNKNNRYDIFSLNDIKDNNLIFIDKVNLSNKITTELYYY